MFGVRPDRFNHDVELASAVDLARYAAGGGNSIAGVRGVPPQLLIRENPMLAFVAAGR